MDERTALEGCGRAAAGIETGLRRWRAANPGATLREIEEEADRRLAPLRTELVRMAAHQGPPATRPPCPECGGPTRRVGTRERTVTTAQDQALTLRGPGYRCPACGAGLFPPR
jgi:YgiT-type zinc finger domain-containing protein